MQERLYSRDKVIRERYLIWYQNHKITKRVSERRQKRNENVLRLLEMIDWYLFVNHSTERFASIKKSTCLWYECTVMRDSPIRASWRTFQYLSKIPVISENAAKKFTAESQYYTSYKMQPVMTYHSLHYNFPDNCHDEILVGFFTHRMDGLYFLPSRY